MASHLIEDQGTDFTILGTRLSVYDLLPYFLDPTVTESYICQIYSLTMEQVAAARSSAFQNADVVLAKHLEIEKRLSAQNPPEIIERARTTLQHLRTFKEWLAERRSVEGETAPLNLDSNERVTGTTRMLTFREWLKLQEKNSLPDKSDDHVS